MPGPKINENEIIKFIFLTSKFNKLVYQAVLLKFLDKKLLFH